MHQVLRTAASAATEACALQRSALLWLHWLATATFLAVVVSDGAVDPGPLMIVVVVLLHRWWLPRRIRPCVDRLATVNAACALVGLESIVVERLGPFRGGWLATAAGLQALGLLTGLPTCTHAACAALFVYTATALQDVDRVEGDVLGQVRRQLWRLTEHGEVHGPGCVLISE